MQVDKVLKLATKFIKLLEAPKVTASLLATISEVYEQITLFLDQTPSLTFLKFITIVAQ